MLENKHRSGWIFNLDSIQSLKHYIKNGVYSTKVKPSTNNGWNAAYTGTIADYASMRAGDLVYFFIRRKIYGVGQLIDLEGTNSCVFCNFENALLPQTPQKFQFPQKKFLSENLFYYENDVWDKEFEEGRTFQQRWFCTFKPSPVFYDGVDMDDLLKQDESHRDLRGLRTFWKLSFIKLSPSENEIFLNFIKEKQLKPLGYQSSYNDNHKFLKNRYKTKYEFNLKKLVKANTNKNGSLKSEMVLESYILNNFEKPKIKNIFGSWDYFSHQVTASPFKPRDYMDKMDIYGYSGGEGGVFNAKKHLLIEIKKGKATQRDVNQALKYVEWLKWEYGTEKDINAYLIAFDFEKNLSFKSITPIKYKSIDAKIALTKQLN